MIELNVPAGAPAPWLADRLAELDRVRSEQVVLVSGIERLDRATSRGPLPRPRITVVAAVAGDCLDDACTALGALTDIRVGSPDTRFGFPGPVGTTAARSGLAAQLPYAVLARLVFAGELLDAAAARRAGLLTDVDAGPLGRAREIAKAVEGVAPVALRGEKAALAESRGMSFAQDRIHAAAIDIVAHMGPDAEEGMRAFVEKRPATIWRFE